ncbi:flippase-like domain-containing protein [Actinocrinis puniceicyclus]|uniref:Flippase-like domain-containing protein n=1 Tax=Actinocrinis puniceicyclus TaxID=977794 RepID=A0A8J7WN85_9ACTN|nr:lysylphosphatidylglycerol synthase transmembrane domain-containing protein [Actinocrinis puniceicyclus]MBS2965501.1 flippase-like domain-containing protein [Actinocrinis puniceicyclus]
MEDRAITASESIETAEHRGAEHRAGSPAEGRRSLAGRATALLGSNAVRVGFVLVAVGLGFFAVAGQWSQVRAAFADLGPGSIAGALAMVLLALFVSMLVWRSLMAAAGSPVPLAAAARIFFVGQIGKYVPGAVWPVLAQMELGRARLIPRQRSATVAVVKILVDLSAGLLVSAVALVAGLTSSGTAGYRWAFLGIPVVLVCLHPRVLNPVIDRLLRLVRRPAQEPPLTGRAIVVAMLWALLSWVLFGLSVWLLAVRLGAPQGRAFLLSAGGFAFAWCIGFLVVFAPAGAGVREVVLVAALSPVLGVGKATAVALLSRLLTTVADLLSVGFVALFGRVRPGRGPAPAPPPQDPGRAG